VPAAAVPHLPRERTRPARRLWPDARRAASGRHRRRARRRSIALPRAPARRALRAGFARRRLRAPEPDRLLVLRAIRGGTGGAGVDLLRRPDAVGALAPARRADRPSARAGPHPGLLPPDRGSPADGGRL